MAFNLKLYPNRIKKTDKAATSLPFIKTKSNGEKTNLIVLLTEKWV